MSAHYLSRKNTARRLSVGALIFLGSIAGAQQNARNRGGIDEDVPVPSHTQTPSQQTSATGIGELQIHAQKVGASAWRGMYATGTMTYARAPDPLPTTLTMLPGNRVRLTVTERDTQHDFVSAPNGQYWTACVPLNFAALLGYQQRRAAE